jgi:hypothetical protein
MDILLLDLGIGKNTQDGILILSLILDAYRT